MKKLNEKNLNFIAHVATSIENFHLLTAIDLCIDEWYMGNLIEKEIKHGSAAYTEFEKKAIGKHQSVIMNDCLREFFEVYIAPKYILIQKYVYDYLNKLEKKETDSVFKPGTHNEYDEYKIEHHLELMDLIRDNITDWHFGFEVKEEVSFIPEKPINKSQNNPILFPLPKEQINVNWAFSNKIYTGIEDFGIDLKSYNKKNKKFQADKIVFENSKIGIRYGLWVKGMDDNDILPNEKLLGFENDYWKYEAAAEFKKEDKSTYERYKSNVLATLNADDNKSFTAIELLFKINQQLANKELGDHVFFEGLGVDLDATIEIPSYLLINGS